MKRDPDYLWLAIRPSPSDAVNAVCVGGWLDWDEWRLGLVPWLLRECAPLSPGHVRRIVAAGEVTP